MPEDSLLYHKDDALLSPPLEWPTTPAGDDKLGERKEKKEKAKMKTIIANAEDEWEMSDMSEDDDEGDSVDCLVGSRSARPPPSDVFFLSEDPLLEEEENDVKRRDDNMKSPFLRLQRLEALAWSRQVPDLIQVTALNGPDVCRLCHVNMGSHEFTVVDEERKWTDPSAADPVYIRWPCSLLHYHRAHGIPLSPILTQVASAIPDSLLFPVPRCSRALFI